MLLSEYQSQVQDLLHDPNAQVWTIAQLTSYINEARGRVAVDTKCLRQIMTPTNFPALQFPQGLEFFNPQTFLDPSVGPNLVDTLNIVIIVNSARKTLAYRPYTWLTSNQRPWANYQSYPRFWSKVSPAQYVIAPVPSQTYQCEFDVAVKPTKLFDDTSTDQIPVPFQDCVQYYACYKAKVNQQQLQEAQLMYALYVSDVRRIAAAYWGRLNPYPNGER